VAKHALLSASTSARWLNCTPSVYAEQGEPVTCSVYAKEGTDAHELGELKLQRAFGKMTEDEYLGALEMFKTRSEYYNEEMDEFVDEYVNMVKEQSEGCIDIKFEQKVDFSHIVPDGFGTSDTVIIFPNKVVIVDLKYGKGVPVTAEDNSQLSLYALGTIHTLNLKVEDIRVCICQPRISNYSSWDVKFETLNKWGEEYVRPRAQLAIKGEGTLVPGDKQCRFCKLAGKCKARADLRLNEAREAFGGEVTDLVVAEDRKELVKQLSLEKLAIVLEIAPLYAEWLKDVEAYAYQIAMSGTQIPGYKLVQGRTVRKVDDEEGLLQTLLAQGYSEKELMKAPSLNNLTTLEKVVGKNTFASIAAPYISKPIGKPTLVPESDRRAPINFTEIAKQVFSEEPLAIEE
jgi:hypothetical protein